MSNNWKHIVRENLTKSIDLEKGIMFWNRELGERENKLKIRESKDGATYERRYICSDCVYYLISQFKK